MPQAQKAYWIKTKAGPLCTWSTFKPHVHEVSFGVLSKEKDIAYLIQGSEDSYWAVEEPVWA